MNYHSFVEKMTVVSPTLDDYLKHGVSNEYAFAASKNFTAIPRQNVNNASLRNIGLIDLIDNFDCNKMQIGLISFLPNVKEYQDYYYVGNVEADILAISKITLEIVVLDHEDHECIIWPCSKDSNNFLDAVFDFATYLSIKIKNTSKPDLSLDTHFISTCTEKAGGEKYEAFYEMLIAG